MTVSLFQWGGGGHVTIAYDALDLTIQAPTQPCLPPDIRCGTPGPAPPPVISGDHHWSQTCPSGGHRSTYGWQADGFLVILCFLVPFTMFENNEQKSLEF